MGYHYLPKYYLKGFSNNGRSIWMYEKGTDTRIQSQIKTVANITDFYSDEIEQFMADKIEAPANTVIDKIRNKEKVNNEDKKIFSDYISVMWKRVPDAVIRVFDKLPNVSEKLKQRIEQEFTGHDVSPYVEDLKNDLQKAIDDVAKDSQKDIWQSGIPPEQTPKMISALNAMEWEYFYIDKEMNESFLTCDNPVFYFKSLGIGNNDSEITFPISTEVTLFATWRKRSSNDYIKASKQVIREINRRTAQNATRYVFHSRNEYWINSFINKGHWELNRII